MFTSYDKAIAAVLTGFVSVLALTGLNLPSFLTDPATVAVLSSVITGLVTYLVPNKKPV